MRILAVLSLAFLIACGSEEEPIPPGPITLASADIHFVSSDDGDNFIKGEQMGNVSLEYQDGVTTMVITVTKMTPNTKHAMHLHLGSLEVPGRHWNQNAFTAFCNVESMGNLWAKPFAGDVGNIEIDENGIGTFTIQTDLWSLGTEEDSDIQNTVLFIHENEEDFLYECDPNHSHIHGHMNPKIAGGTIELGEQILP